MSAPKRGSKTSNKARAKRPSSVTIKLMQQAHAKGLPQPEYQTALSAGMDLLAALPKKQPLTLKPGKHCLIPTGLILEIPAGYEAQVRPRSGLAFKHGITVLNSPGTIDPDYRGEVGVLLINHGQKSFKIQRGERIAQLVITPVTRAKIKNVKTTSETKRGSGGFGSTGVKAKKERVKNSKKTTNVAQKRPRKIKSARTRPSKK